MRTWMTNRLNKLDTRQFMDFISDVPISAEKKMNDRLALAAAAFPFVPIASLTRSTNNQVHNFQQCDPRYVIPPNATKPAPLIFK